MKKIVIITSILIFILSFSALSQSAKKIKKQANADFNQNNYKEAIIAYTKVIEIDPDNYKTLYNRGVCYEKTKQIKNAISDYSSCLKIDYKEKDLYLKIADLYMQLNNYKDANVVLERLTNYDKWHSEGLRKSAWCHIILKEFEQAVAKTDRAINKDSNSEDTGTEIAHYYRGIAKDSLGDYNAAILSYKKAIAIIKGREINRIKAKPEYKPYYINMATAYYKTKLYDESIKNYDIGISIDQADTVLPSNYFIYFLKSLPFIAKSDFNSAIGDLNRAIVLNNKSPMLFFQRGIIYKQTSQYQSAISDFTKSILLDESFDLAYLFKAQCQMELGSTKEAISDLKQCLKQNKNNKEAQDLLKTAEEKKLFSK